MEDFSHMDSQKTWDKCQIEEVTKKDVTTSQDRLQWSVVWKAFLLSSNV